jgi:PAS domain S-box-containing protein
LLHQDQPAFEHTLGYTLAAFTAHPFIHYVHPDDVETTLAAYAALRSGKGAVAFENRYRCRDESYKWLMWNATPIKDGLTYCTAHDITARKQLERRLAQIVESAPDAIVIADAAGEMTLVNAETERMFGYGRLELIGESVELLVPERYRKRHARHRAGYSKNPHTRSINSELELELRGRRKDGSEFPVEISLSPLETDEGTLITSAIRDVTERKRLEHLAAVVGSSADAIISKTVDGIIVSWNHGAERLYGYSAAEAIGRPITILMPEGHHHEELERIDRVVRGEAIDQFETVRVRNDGSLIDVWMTLSALRDPNGDVIGASTVARDITGQTRAEAELRQARAEIDRFFGLSLDLMVIANDSGHFISVNAACEPLLGHTPDEMLGRPFIDFIHPDDRESTLATYAAQADGTAVSGFENRYRCKDGSYRWLLWSATPVENGLVYATGRDVTERRQMEDALREASANAIEASRQKSEFVANMSHEIRTPLSAVMGMVEVLRETALDPVQSEYVDFLAASGDALLALVNDILDFSKIEAGRLDLDPTAFDLRRAVGEACVVLAEQAHARGLDFTFKVDADVPVAVNGDRARLRQILLNLLSNAVKFTTAGEVALHVSSAGGEHVHFAVSDTGIGIDQPLAARLFEPFTQADQSTTRNYGGTGLGLAISRQLVERMGGEIGAQQRVGGGSVFWFTAALPEVTTAPEAADESSDWPGRRVLIAHRRSPERRILEQRMEHWGFVCKSVEELGEAIAALEQASEDELPFDLALVDFALPQENGLRIVHAIRESASSRPVSIVMLNSAQIEPESLADAGVSAFLPGSATSSQLYNAVARALAGARPGPDPEAGASSTTALQGPLVLIAEDHEALRAAARGRLAARGIRTAFAANGLEAVRMASACEYAAILMDCQMPELDGYEATRRIRAAERDRHVPIIAMTAHAMTGDRERCLGAGMDGYLSKPVLNKDLDAILRRWLPDYEPGDHTQRGNNGAEADTGPVAEQTDAVLHHTTVQELSESVTPEMRRRLIQTFEHSLSDCVADIESAVRGHNPAELRRVAHTLKGLGATFGANRLRLCGQRLERVGSDADQAIGEQQLEELQVIASEARQALRQHML